MLKNTSKTNFTNINLKQFATFSNNTIDGCVATAARLGPAVSNVANAISDPSNLVNCLTRKLPSP
jgi:hypothetical protein